MSGQSTKRQKVYIDALHISFPNLSGIGHVVLNTVNELDKDEEFIKEHEIVLFTSRRGLPRLKSLEFKNVSYKTWPIRTKIINGLNYYNLLPPIDLFMGRGIYIFASFANWPLMFSKSITYIYDIGYEKYPQFSKPSVYKVLHKSVPKWIKRTNQVVTVSDHSRSEIHKLYKTPPEKITVIPCGIDNKTFYPRNTSEINKVRAKYNLTKPYILFLSNLEPRKNLERLVKAFELLPADRRRNLTLFLVGSEGWQDEAIQVAIGEAVNKGSDIKKPEAYIPDEDLPSLISGAEFLAHPAVYEGFGMSVLESMACGTPVLVSRQGSLPEVVGDAGIYVDYNDTKDIAKKMNDLLTDSSLSKNLARVGINRSRQFTWQNSTKLLKGLINELKNN